MQNSTTQPRAYLAPVEKEQAANKLISRIQAAAKRALDLCIAAILLVLLSPVLLLVAIWIKRDTPGPVFYRGPRLGKGGKIFHMLKFRTMHESPESYAGPRLTAQDDPRITRVGRWLRDSKVNELPQLWNVLLGEMSLVGPRPEDPAIGAAWPQDVRQEVLSVRPGITSPASVLYRNEESLLSRSRLMDNYLGDILPSKLRLDQLYVRHRSTLLDLDTLFWTAMVLMPKMGTASPHEDRLFVGPFSRLVQRYVSWFMIDVSVTLLAMAVTGVFWRSFEVLNVGLWRAAGIAMVFAVLYSLVGALMGVNRILWSKAGLSDAIDLFPAIGIATIIALAANYFVYDKPLLPPILILMAAVLAYGGFVVVRYRGRLVQALAHRWIKLRAGAYQAQERVLIVGGGESGQFMAWYLQNGSAAGTFRVVGYIDDDMYKQNTRIRGVDVLGKREDIPALVSQHDVGVILFAIHNIPIEERRQLLSICARTPARVMQVPDVLGDLREIVRGSGSQEPASGEGSSPADADMKGYLPVEKVAAWLSELRQMSRAGDLSAVQTRLKMIQGQIETDQPE